MKRPESLPLWRNERQDLSNEKTIEWQLDVLQVSFGHSDRNIISKYVLDAGRSSPWLDDLWYRKSVWTGHKLLSKDYQQKAASWQGGSGHAKDGTDLWRCLYGYNDLFESKRNFHMETWLFGICRWSDRQIRGRRQWTSCPQWIPSAKQPLVSGLRHLPRCVACHFPCGSSRT